MKMKTEHFQYIKSEIEKFIGDDLEKLKTIYENGAFNNADKVKDLDKRFRWDMFHFAKLLQFQCDTLYDYLNDDHIDTALREIFKDVKLVNRYKDNKIQVIHIS